MNKVLKDLISTIAYLDDIIIYSKTAEEHLDDLQQVLHRLHNTELSMKLSKSNFFAKVVKYLDHVLSTTDIKLLPFKMAAIKLMNPHENALQVIEFLGLVGYYHMFIKNIAWIAKLLTPIYSSRREVSLGIRSPCSIQHPQKCFDRSTYCSLPRSFRTLHSIHRCLR